MMTTNHPTRNTKTKKQKKLFFLNIPSAFIQEQ